MNKNEYILDDVEDKPIKRVKNEKISKESLNEIKSDSDTDIIEDSPSQQKQS